MSFVQEAFNRVCTEAKQAGTWYVSLMEAVPFYGGPEEGGWWGSDTVLVAYQQFASIEQAEAAAEQVEQLAEQLGEESKRSSDEACLRSMEWLDARGLEADYLPEPDGGSSFYVLVTEGLPEGSQGVRHYE